MTKLNRSGALLLALVLFLSLLLPYAGALSEPEDDVVTTQTIDGVTYELHADYAVLINGKQAKGDLVLPAEVDGRPLERIEIWAFQSNTALTSVVIPDTVTQIGGSAFEQCESLESISFGDGIEILPNGVCDYCFSLHTVRLPAALKEIGDDAFSFCFALEELTLPASLRRIGRSAFSSTRIRQLLFPAGLEEIGSSAFYDTPLGMVYLSPSFRYDALTSMGSTTESVRSLGAYIYHVYHHGTAAETYVNKLKAQDGDANVYSYALPDTGQLYMTASGVYQLEKGEMTLLLYPAMLSTAPFLVDSYVNGVPVTSVGPNAFRESHNHGGDRIIILPPTVTTISEYAFSDIKNGLVVHIPSSVTSIHETAFDGLEYIVIYGVPGSEAERFAKRHGIRFETDVSGVLPFTDVKPAAWYYGSVVYAYYNGLMNGVSRTRFAPGQSMSRAML
ncbi:MAG: leucine-rich repeat protein, partial [Oscillospiraceae bacterium]|nr:leucine-rich repeat protein [Oscillospiraceae bacterium]